jgi:adenosine deaminase
MNSLADFIAGITKAELHLHIEGTLEPKLSITIGKRYGVDYNVTIPRTHLHLEAQLLTGARTSLSCNESRIKIFHPTQFCFRVKYLL